MEAAVAGGVAKIDGEIRGSTEDSRSQVGGTVQACELGLPATTDLR